MFSTKRSASRFDSDNESGPKIARRDSYGMSSAEPRQRFVKMLKYYFHVFL